MLLLETLVGLNERDKDELEEGFEVDEESVETVEVVEGIGVAAGAESVLEDCVAVDSEVSEASELLLELTAAEEVAEECVDRDSDVDEEGGGSGANDRD